MNAINATTKKVPLILRVVPFYVLTAGILLLFGLLYPGETARLTTESSTSIGLTVAPDMARKITNKHIISGQPTRITVERLAIDLTIHNGYYDQKTKDWTLSDNTAYYAAMTTAPNNSRGNTFIYGHNTSKVFAPLKDIEAGDAVNIYTTNGRIFRYTYRNDAVVTPDITTVLYENPSPPQLTVMTCEGVWSKVRRIMYFDYKAVI